MTSTEQTQVSSSRLPQLPLTTIKGNDLSIAERRDVIRVYNTAISKFSTTDLPRVKFNFKTNKSNKIGLSKHKHAYKSYTKKWSNRPIFTEGISSHSKKQEPVFYLKTSSVVSSNLPHGIHYSRDKSKLVLETKPKVEKKSVSNGTTPLPSSRLSMSDKTPRSISVSRNYTLLLPKVHIEKEISIIDYVRSGHTTKEQTHFAPLVPTVEEVQTKPADTSGQQPNNTPANSRGLEKPAEPMNLVREASNVSNVSGRNRADRSELSSRKSIRINASDIHKVSVGEDLDFSFYRNYGRQSVPPSAEYELERQKSFESRAALSTPGKSKYARSIKNIDGKSLDAKSMASSSFKTHNSKPLAWESSAVQSDGQSEAADVLGDSYDAAKSKGVIKKYTIGDPVKDSNIQDKKLDKSNLTDLYSRGVVRDHLSNCKPQPSSRVTVQMLKRDDRNGKFGGSHASGLSTIPGNPPPSLATYLASPAYDGNKKSHHPLLSPEMTYVSQGLLVEGSTLGNSPEAKSARSRGKLTIDGALLNKIESEKEKHIAETFIDKYEKTV